MKKKILFFALLFLFFTKNTHCSNLTQPLTPRSQAAHNIREVCYSDESDATAFPEYQKNLVRLTLLDPQRAAQVLGQKEELFDHAPFFGGVESLHKIKDHAKYFKFSQLNHTTEYSGITQWRRATILGLMVAKQPVSFLQAALPHVNINKDTMGASRMHIEHLGAMTDDCGWNDAMDRREKLSLLDLAKTSPLDSDQKVKLLEDKFPNK